MTRKRTNVEKIREILRLYLELNYSLRDAAIALGVSKTTVGEYIAEFKRTGLSYQEITRMSDTEVIDLFENRNKSSNPMYEDLSKNFAYMEKELKRTGVTLYLLWEEYRQQQDAGLVIQGTVIITGCGSAGRIRICTWSIRQETLHTWILPVRRCK